MKRHSESQLKWHRDLIGHEKPLTPKNEKFNFVSLSRLQIGAEDSSQLGQSKVQVGQEIWQ
jgi:hypothetical protein